MISINSFVTLLLIVLATLTAALPQVYPPNQPHVGGFAGYTGLNVNLTSDVNETTSAYQAPGFVNLYKDKNEAHDTIIDPNTCRGNAEIALMKWRSNCKAFSAVMRLSCWTDAPSFQRCCPLPTKKSCTHYWPKQGEWERCLQMRRECGPDCNWKALTNSVQWCWKYAPDI